MNRDELIQKTEGDDALFAARVAARDAWNKWNDAQEELAAEIERWANENGLDENEQAELEEAIVDRVTQ
jgi:hypothetical protein